MAQPLKKYFTENKRIELAPQIEKVWPILWALAPRKCA
jgi:hypothetical protein